MPLLLQAVLEPTPSSGHTQTKWGGGAVAPACPGTATAQGPERSEGHLRPHSKAATEMPLGQLGSCRKTSGGLPGCAYLGFLPTRMGLCTTLNSNKKQNTFFHPELKSTSRKILQEVLLLAQLGLARYFILPLNRNCRGGCLFVLPQLLCWLPLPWAGSWEQPLSEGWAGAWAALPPLCHAAWPVDWGGGGRQQGKEGGCPTAGRDLST